MHHFLVWLESTAFSVWMREATTVFAFPGILACHTVGMGLVAGINALVDLRILGIAPQVPVIEMRRFFPVMWFGFWLNAVSGVALLIGYPTKALTNPVFYGKLVFIAIAVAILRSIQRRVFSAASVPMGNVKPLAVASIVCWAGAIFAGRFLAYTYSKLTSFD